MSQMIQSRRLVSTSLFKSSFQVIIYVASTENGTLCRAETERIIFDENYKKRDLKHEHMRFPVSCEQIFFEEKQCMRASVQWIF